jgi:2-polyprenyl-3-methyl-5-hydroxy-6-metoxy-1,4-benzoquinol methylase
MSSRDERQARTDFAERYATATGDVNARIEQAVIGAVWGANGYTTVDQADELGRRLQLGPGKRLLDVGTGRGWPGLYLAQQTGCQVIGTDLPVEGLEVGRRRARDDGIAERVSLAVAGAADLPFPERSFDAIVHTDVLC